MKYTFVLCQHDGRLLACFGTDNIIVHPRRDTERQRLVYNNITFVRVFLRRRALGFHEIGIRTSEITLGCTNNFCFPSFGRYLRQ
jgi:hypothetical protein